MENKKTSKASLVKKRNLFLVLGLAISLSATLMAFEWKTFGEGELMDLGRIDDDFDQCIVDFGSDLDGASDGHRTLCITEPKGPLAPG